MKFQKAPPENVELLDRVVGSLPGTQRRTMFGYAAYFANGKLAVGLFADGVCMKLGDEDRAKAFKIAGVTEFAPMQGRVMKEYAFFTKPVLNDEARLKRWARKSVEHTASAASRKPVGRRRASAPRTWLPSLRTN